MNRGLERGQTAGVGRSVLLRSLGGILLAGLGLGPWTNAAPAATLAGTVVAVSGSCTVRDRILRSNDPVRVSDTIIVAPDANIKLQMVDASVIMVAPGSRVTVETYDVGAGRDVKLAMGEGSLRAQVSPVARPSTFEVSTAVGTASVQSGSADWFVVARSGWAQVGVLAGTVDLTSATTRQSVSIPARWGTRLEARRDPVLPRVWSQMEFSALIRVTECCPARTPGP